MTQNPVQRTVRLPGATIHIYGVLHGFRQEHKPNAVMARPLQRQLSAVPQGHYAIIEGAHESHYQALLPDEDISDALVDHIGGTLRRLGLDRYVESAERPEFYDAWLSHAIDPSGAIDAYTYRTLGEEAQSQNTQATIRSLSQTPFLTHAEIKKLKTGLIDELQSALPNMPRRTIEDHVEATTTLRSLLLARTALYRAIALKQHVHITAGPLHTGEIEHFLKDEQNARRYLETVSPMLQEVFLANEHCNQAIGRLFGRFAGIGSPLCNPNFLTRLAHTVQLKYIAAMFTREHPNLSSITPETVMSS